MTLRVTITHDQPAYPADISVMTCDISGMPTGAPTAVIKPGESASFYVHSNQTLILEERAH